jgi:hypothetical protein
VDVDGSGAVEWEEFCVLMHKKGSFNLLRPWEWQN